MIRLSSPRSDDPAPLAIALELREINEHLHASPHTALRQVVCEMDGDALVLSGHVESYYLKQVAQETLRRLKPDQMIVNTLTVD